jgi:hypothetical protein
MNPAKREELLLKSKEQISISISVKTKKEVFYEA